MKLTRLHKIILFLTALLICLLSYQFILEHGLNQMLILVLVGVPIVVIMIIAFFVTKPDNLANSEYRNSKKGRTEWDDRNSELMSSDEKKSQ